MGCRLEYARQWAMRLSHEKKLHEESCFLTLTYDDEHLPKDLSLNKRDITLFMKRLRKRYPNKRIRYFQCGEYGEKNNRPHHHVILFGHQFPDSNVLVEGTEYDLKESEELSQLWGKGFTTVGEVTFQSCSYVARYVTKKMTGEKAKDHYRGRLPEYCTMSRGGKDGVGIGGDYYEQFSRDMYPSDTVVLNGKVMQPPKYYDKKLELDNPYEYVKIKAKRMKRDQFKDSCYKGKTFMESREMFGDRLEKKEYVKKAEQECFAGRKI